MRFLPTCVSSSPRGIQGACEGPPPRSGRTGVPAAWRAALGRDVGGAGYSPRTRVGQLEMRAFRPW